MMPSFGADSGHKEGTADHRGDHAQPALQIRRLAVREPREQARARRPSKPSGRYLEVPADDRRGLVRQTQALARGLSRSSRPDHQGREIRDHQPVDGEERRLKGRLRWRVACANDEADAPSGALTSVAQTPGQGPAERLAITTAPKKSTKGAPVPVTGSRTFRSPNAAATRTTPNAQRTRTLSNAHRLTGFGERLESIERQESIFGPGFAWQGRSPFAFSGIGSKDYAFTLPGNHRIYISRWPPSGYGIPLRASGAK
jgi:hypothetical protein